jgi:hypothetical protein
MSRALSYFRGRPFTAVLGLSLLVQACSQIAPTAPADSRASILASTSWGPETPHFNLEVILRDPSGGGTKGHVKFRQPNDAFEIVQLGTTLRGLAPNTHFRLQRAADAPDGACTSTTWLTLGKGAVAQDIVTDDDGNGAEDLFRVLTNPPGTQFDIAFRVIDANTGAVVLVSDCYEFTISL